MYINNNKTNNDDNNSDNNDNLTVGPVVLGPAQAVVGVQHAVLRGPQ